MRSGISLRLYSAGSFAAAALVILNAWMQHEQFYPTLVGLSNSAVALIALGNVAIAACVLIGIGIKKFFLGTLRENEFEHLAEKVYPTIIDLFLMVTLFRTSLSVSFFAMLGLLMGAKCLHWLVNKRVEFMGQFPMTSIATYVRLVTFMILLAAVDALVVTKSVQSILVESKGFWQLLSFDGETQGPSIHILYGFEFAVLFVMILGSLVRSGLILWELWAHQGRWDDKSAYIMYSDFGADVLQFGIYGLFFLTLYAHVGLPITLIRPLLVAFSNFRKRVADLMRYRQATQNAEQRFPEATAEEMAGRMCVICREDLTSGRKLPCGHILHLRCLKEWLEHQQTCPTCRAPVVEDPNAPRPAGADVNANPGGAPIPNAQIALGGHGQHPFFAANGIGPFGPMPQHGFGFRPGIHNPAFQEAFLAHLARQRVHQAPANLQQPAQPEAPQEDQPNRDTTASPAPSAEPSNQEDASPAPSSSSSSLPPHVTRNPVASPSSSSPLHFSNSMHAATPPAPSPSPIHHDIAQDIQELTSSIVRDLDSLRARMDVLTALLASQGIQVAPTQSHSSSSMASSSSPGM